MPDDFPRHRHYFEITAPSYFALGFSLGSMFYRTYRDAVNEARSNPQWEKMMDLARPCLEACARNFPIYREEFDGVARGAGVSVEDLWTAIEFDLSETSKHRCTTLVTNKGMLIGHNEDWSFDAKDSICILKKQLPHCTILELFYYPSCGGNALSVNSYGYIQAINSLYHTDTQTGLSGNIIARWLSETSSPEADCGQLLFLKRATGYSHTIVGSHGRLLNIECSAREYIVTSPAMPFVHTNHFLTQLRTMEGNDDESGSWSRFSKARLKLGPDMTVETLKCLMSDETLGREKSIFNVRTIARTIVDMREMTLYGWLLREKDLGWVRYPLDFIP